MVTARRPAKRSKQTPKKKAGFDSFAFALALSKEIPRAEQARAPRDLSYNFDHYQDGSPKQP
jgi:hypothetical protein